MVKYCELFYSFLKIGAFTIGGGYAMIPVMEDELVDKRHWMSREEFLDQLALSQSMPGVLAVNMATGLGYRLRGAWGAMSAVAGNIVAPIMIVLLLAMFFRQLRGYRSVSPSRHKSLGLLAGFPYCRHCLFGFLT